MQEQLVLFLSSDFEEDRVEVVVAPARVQDLSALGTCIWLDGHDSWHQEGKIQPNSNAGHVWGSLRKFLWVETVGIITMNSVDQDMGSVKWLGSVLSTSLIGSNYFTTMIVVSLQSAPEPTQKTSLTRLGGENHEEPPRTFVSDQRSVATGRKEPGQIDMT